MAKLMAKLLGRTAGALITVLGSLPAHAEDIRIGQPGFGGTGCPAGTASATLSPDQKQLSILFDRYSVEAGGPSLRRLDQKNCNIASPVHVPQGYSISVFQVDYRGFAAVPQGARAEFDIEYFFTGTKGSREKKVLTGPAASDYLFTDLLRNENLVWSPCGQATNLRVRTSFTVYSNAALEQTMATVDSMDLNGSLVYSLVWKKCTNPPPNTTPPSDGSNHIPVPVPPPPPPRPNVEIVKGEKSLGANRTNGDGWTLQCPSGYRAADTSWSGADDNRICKFEKRENKAVLKCDNRLTRINKDLKIKYSLKCSLR
jgi:hypothetical protein